MENEKPPQPKTREQLEHEQDMREAEDGLRLLEKMKAIKAKYPKHPKVENLADVIPNYNGETGEALTAEQKIAWVRAKKPEIQIPNFDGVDGHKLSPEEQLERITRK